MSAENPIHTTITVFASAELFHVARVLALEAQTDPVKAIAAVPMAAAAIEAYLNDLAHWTRHISRPQSEEWYFAELYEYAEEARRPALHRAELVSRVFGRKRPDLGSPLWQNLALLFQVRDAMMHKRPETWSSDESKPMPTERIGSELLRKKIATRPDPLSSNERAVPLAQIVAQPSVARWAFNTAVDAWQEIMHLLPKSIKFIAFTGAQPMKLDRLE